MQDAGVNLTIDVGGALDDLLSDPNFGDLDPHDLVQHITSSLGLDSPEALDALVGRLPNNPFGSSLFDDQERFSDLFDAFERWLESTEAIDKDGDGAPDERDFRAWARGSGQRDIHGRRRGGSGWTLSRHDPIPIARRRSGGVRLGARSGSVHAGWIGAGRLLRA